MVVIQINPGKIFEQEFKDSTPDDVWIHRIKDPAQSFGKQQNVRFSPKNEFDYLLFKSPNLYALELKSTKGTQFQFSTTINDKMIKASQIDQLTKVSKYENVISGLLFNFRKTEHTYFLLIADFNNFISKTNKVQINEKDIINNNGILIPQKKKRTRYQYDISPIIYCQGGDKDGKD